MPSRKPGAIATIGEETVRVDDAGNVLERKPIVVRYFTEQIGAVSLDMVAIPGGKFLGGSPKSEEGRWDWVESYELQVSVSEFWMGRYAVTQAQWQAVAQLPPVKCTLDFDPSRFKGERHPVEQVSWDEAKEFCARLSRLTGNMYRLPSDVEWEYACRAGTTTPFACGGTLTTAIANYNGTHTYAKGSVGEFRQGTIEVGSFPPNAWGLYDVHGNVFEWCEDPWQHRNSTRRVKRGGAWLSSPKYCRSAYRFCETRKARNSHLGVRVACSASDVLRPANESYTKPGK